MPPLLGKARVIDDPGFDPPATLDRLQRELAHPGQHRSVRPWCIAHKMQQGFANAYKLFRRYRRRPPRRRPRHREPTATQEFQGGAALVSELNRFSCSLL